MVKMDLKSSMKTSIRACSYSVLLSWLCTEALLATLPSIQYTIPNNTHRYSVTNPFTTLTVIGSLTVTAESQGPAFAATGRL